MNIRGFFSEHRQSLMIILFLALMLLSVIAACSCGSADIQIRSVLKAMIDSDALSKADRVIIFDLRLPRVFAALAAGAALAVSGCGFQGILRNPLADPYIVGTSSGACLGASLAIVMHVPDICSFISSVPLAAFLGACAAMAAVYALSQSKGAVPAETFLLSGVIVSSFAGAAVSFLMTAAGQDLQRVILWMIGTLSQTDKSSALVMLPYLAAGITAMMLCAEQLNIMGMGEERAKALGVDTDKLKTAVIVSCSFMTAAAVSCAGMIGFLGLVVPHVTRLFIGPDHKVLIPAAAINGGAFLVFADTLARTAAAPQELPAGVITALAGAPFFFWVMRRKMKG